MKRYKVIFHPLAEQDLRTSFGWGVAVWGKTQAKRWLHKFYATCKKRLSRFPESCSIAQDSEDLGRELRQFVIDRYRVIFTIKDDTVIVLYVRGAYVGTLFDDANESD